MEIHKLIHMHNEKKPLIEKKLKPLGFPTKLNKDKKDRKSFLSKRSYAFAIDFFLIGLINKAVIFTYASFMKTNFFLVPTEKQLSIMGNLDKLHFPTLLCVYWGYYILSLYMGNGQTPGKIALHLRIIDENGGPHLTMRECVMRTFGYFICTCSGFFLLGIPYFTKDSRGIPDWLSNTRVFTKDELAELEANEDHSIQLDLFKHVLPLQEREFRFSKTEAELQTEHGLHLVDKEASADEEKTDSEDDDLMKIA